MTTVLQPPLLRLVIARRDEIATDIHAFELRDAAGAALPPFSAGSHIGVQTADGNVRKYSLTNDPEESDRYMIAVKREGAGRGGSSMRIRRATCSIARRRATISRWPSGPRSSSSSPVESASRR